MTLNLGIIVLVLIAGVLLTIIATWLIDYQKTEYTCVTCGKRHNDKSLLIKCPKCQKWFCANNLEKIEEAHTTSQKIIEIIPSKLIPEYPCGTEYVNMEKTENIYCKKDSKRFSFTIRLKIERK